MGESEQLEAELIRELEGWGGSSEMSAFEGVMWRAEADPQLKSTITAVMVLDAVPDWERLLAAHQWLVDTVPRFRERVVVPALSIGNPVWVEDTNFQLDYHLRRVSLPAPGSMRQYLDFAQTQAMIPFEKARSPWEATLVEGLEGGRAGYVLKMHHSTTDGMGVFQLLSRVLSKQRAPIGRKGPQGLRRARAGRESPMSAAARQIVGGAVSAPMNVARAAGSLTRSLRDMASDARELDKAREYLQSARRVMGIKPVKGSGLFRKRSLSWRFDCLEFSLEEFKAGAKAAEGTINDAFLSGLIGGFRRYHEEMGVSCSQMPIGFPISLRTDNDPMGGNKFAGAQYAAPLDEPDPIERVRHVQRFVRNTRAEPAMDIVIRLMPVVSRLPLAAITAFTADFVRAQDAQISNVPGMRHPVYMAGAEVVRLFPYAPVPGCGMMITMISHNGTCCVGINSDRAAVTEPELLVDCLREGLDEIIAMGKPKPKAKKRKPARKP